MQLQKYWGTYIPARVAFEGSFRIDGTDDPDDIRDGNTNMIESVEREDVGLFTVTLAEGFPIPEKLVTEDAFLSQTVAPTADAEAVIVLDSYSQSTRSFQVQVRTVAGVATDADDNDRVGFVLVGSVQGIGTDR